MSKLKLDIDKRQMPQVIGLGALTFGLLGYFSFRMLAPSGPAGAAAAAGTTGTQSAVHAELKTGTLAAALAPDSTLADLTNGTAPDAGMRDPFVPLIKADPDAAASAPIRTASALTDPGSLTPVPGLPAPGEPIRALPGFGPGTAPGGLAPMAAPVPAPTWTVTGVVAGSDPGTARIAILRQGDVRRFVRVGAMVDDQYRLIGVDRSGVTLGVGAAHFRIALGSDASKTPRVPVANGAASGFSNGSAPNAVPAPTAPATTPVGAAAPAVGAADAATAGPSTGATNQPSGAATSPVFDDAALAAAGMPQP